MDAGAIIRPMARARTVREGLLRKQDMSKALKVGCGNATGQCGQPSDNRASLGPKTRGKAKASNPG